MLVAPEIGFREISLTRGLTALVDESDFEALVAFSWQAIKGHNGVYYARRNDSRFGSLYMHRVILDAPRGFQVDHVNGDGLDNRRINLRLADPSFQQINSNRINGVSRFRGVYPRSGKWAARIQKYGVVYDLGNFDTQEKAALAYNAKAYELYGSSARINLV